MVLLVCSRGLLEFYWNVFPTGRWGYSSYVSSEGRARVGDPTISTIGTLLETNSQQNAPENRPRAPPKG